jgi:TatD DNase family protein
MIDFHCHLDLFSDPKAVRDECVRRGLYVLSVTTTPSAWLGTSALAEGASRIRTALGLHPQIAHERYGELPLFDQFLAATPYVGEIGLDGHPDFKSHWKRQIDVFEQILEKCSAAGGRVMSIHSRRAAGPVTEALARWPGAGTPVLHWFSGSIRDLDRAIELGCWFSVGPAMLVGESGRRLVSRMPRGRILTESDGPFAQLDGSPVMPWDVGGAIKKLAETWNVPSAEASAILSGNLQTLMMGQQMAAPVAT